MTRECTASGGVKKGVSRFLVGLGNPGPTYEATRHNVGYRVVELLWAEHAEPPTVEGFGVQFRRTETEGIPVILARPRSYMNVSGPPVQRLLEAFEGRPEDLLLIHDDLDLPAGVLRFRRRGSSGGHRGVESVVRALGDGESGNDCFARLKIGVGRPGGEGGDIVDFVLGPPRPEHAVAQTEAESAAAEAAWLWVTEGIDVCMNRFNRKQARAEEGEV